MLIAACEEMLLLISSAQRPFYGCSTSGGNGNADNMPHGRTSDPRCLGFANERAGSTARCSEFSTHRECLALQVAGDDPTDAPKRRVRFQRTKCRLCVNRYSGVHAEDALRSILVVRQVRRCMGATNICAKRYLYVRDRRSPN
jgi:hypothetical protein